MLIYTLFISFKPPPVIIEKPEGPAGVVINQEGAPIKVEETGNMAGNKYLDLYGGDGSQIPRGPRAPPGHKRSDLFAPNPGYYSDADDGETKIYYQNIARRRLNKYINRQNQYVHQVNRRVRQINKNRMYSPGFLRDKASLRDLREFEKVLANQVSCEGANQPYLPDRRYPL